MKTTVILIFSIFLTSFLLEAKTTLKRGTSIFVELATEANSNDNREVKAFVSMDVVDKETDEILIARGTPVVVKVERRKAKGVGKGGWLQIMPVSTTSVDGKQILLNGIFDQTGDDRKGVTLGLGIGSAVTYLPVVGLCFLCLKGEKVVLPRGTTLYDVTVKENYVLDI